MVYFQKLYRLPRKNYSFVNLLLSPKFFMIDFLLFLQCIFPWREKTWNRYWETGKFCYWKHLCFCCLLFPSSSPFIFTFRCQLRFCPPTNLDQGGEQSKLTLRNSHLFYYDSGTGLLLIRKQKQRITHIIQCSCVNPKRHYYWLGSISSQASYPQIDWR